MFCVPIFLVFLFQHNEASANYMIHSLNSANNVPFALNKCQPVTIDFERNVTFAKFICTAETNENPDNHYILRQTCYDSDCSNCESEYKTFDSTQADFFCDGNDDYIIIALNCHAGRENIEYPMYIASDVCVPQPNSESASMYVQYNRDI